MKTMDFTPDEIANMKVRYFNIWDSYGKNEGNITKEDLMPYDIVVIDQAVEFVYTHLSDVEGAVDKVINSAKELNIPVILLTSSRTYEPFEKLSSESLQYDKLKIIDSPGYWIALYFNTSLVPEFHNENISVNNINLLDNDVNLSEPITDLYISMNHIARSHRCMMMDILAKHDMIQYGQIVWRDIIGKFDDNRTEVPDSVRIGYNYKYWTPTRMYLDQEHSISTVIPEVLPSQYKNCFMQLVCETFNDEFLLTEKTAAPLLYNKIFLICGCKDFHKNLVDMGFKLFDNLFDYSFDSIDDQWDRFEGIIKNIKRYKDMSANELTKLYSENEHIIRHNREVALDYALNRIPKQFEMVDAIMRGGQNFVMHHNRVNALYQNLHLKDMVLHNKFRQD